MPHANVGKGACILLGVFGDCACITPRSVMRAVGPPRRSLTARRAGHIWPFAAPAILYLIALSVYPLFELVYMSLCHVTAKNVVSGDWAFVGAGNFGVVLHSHVFYSTTLNTLEFVAIVVGFSMCVGLLAAVLLQDESWLSRLILGIMVFVWAMPPVVLGSLWKFLLLREGTVNAALQSIGVLGAPILWLTREHLVLVSVAFVNAWAVIPFITLVYRAALLNLPRDLLEAAAMDGVRPWRSFVWITFPLLMPATLILSILTIVYAFRSFDFIYVMSSGGPGIASTTLPFLSYKLSFMLYKFGYGAAVAVLTILFVLVMAPLYLRTMRKVEEGA